LQIKASSEWLLNELGPWKENKSGLRKKMTNETNLPGTAKRVVVYDCDVERAAQVAAVLRFLDLQPLLIDHAALMRAIVQAPTLPPALLIGDVGDSLDWPEFAQALNADLSNMPVIVYGSVQDAERLNAAGVNRVTHLPFPFKYAALAVALKVPAGAAAANADDVRLPTGLSQAIRGVISLIRQVAAHDSSVLILGESGTGKELAARAIHDASPRKQRPFVAINCGAIPSELLESELFGHEKGAFTGAVSSRKGRFEIAEGGTLFLDEIGDMSMPMQVKLLRVLQERVFERVGSHAPMRCNVRIIAATHRNLEDSITRGMFREDLFYRLNVFPIEMPPLRGRVDDLPLLIRDFAELSATSGRGRIELSPRCLQALTQYGWPGNVRELGNLMERLSILCPGRVVDVADLPVKYRPADFSVPDFNQLATPSFDTDMLTEAERFELTDAEALETLTDVTDGLPIELPPGGLDLREHLFSIERTLIRQALHRTGGTVAHAARLLNLRRTTLVEKLRKLELLTETAASEV
jgi:sigma-54 dependent transcriptional regulator, flagellar regulatory protein